MDWDDLRYVLAASRSGSFQSAADLLKVSHTTVGRRINALETSLGATLFQRTRDGCTATEVCARLIPTAERMEAEMQRLEALPIEALGEPHGTVRIDTAPWILEHLVTPSLSAFTERYPKIQLSFFGNLVEPKGLPDTCAFSLRFDVMAKRTEVENAFAYVDYSVYAHRDLDADAGGWVTNFGSNLKLRTFDWLERNVADADVRLFADDATLVKAAVIAGVGKGLIPDLLGHQSDELVRVGRESDQLRRTLRALVPRRFATAPELVVTLNWMKQTIVQTLETQGAGGALDYS